MSCSACWAVPPAIGVSGHILSLFYFLLLCLNEKGMRGKSKKNLEVAMKSKGLALAFRLASREVQSLTVRLLVRQQHWALCCVTSREEDLTQSDSASVITSCVETAWGACMMHQVKVGIVGCCKAPYCTVPLGLSIECDMSSSAYHASPVHHALDRLDRPSVLGTFPFDIGKQILQG
ncbi:hypothetical protein HDV57DRAFT_147564 [Trichoderma longibrachiatum]